MKKPKILFFDIGGVCLTNGWGEKSRRRAAEQFSLSFDEMEKRHKPIFGSFENGEVSLENYLEQVIFYEKRAFSKAQFFEFMKGESKPHESTFQILKQLKKQGHLLAALNNEPLELNLFRIEKFQLQDYFSFFCSSCFLGVRKPDPKIFEKALQLTQCDPQECLFIDDRLENAKAAQSAGMQAIHLKEVQNLAAELKTHGILLI